MCPPDESVGLRREKERGRTFPRHITSQRVQPLQKRFIRLPAWLSREAALRRISALWEPVLADERASLWATVTEMKDDDPLYEKVYRDFDAVGTLTGGRDTSEFVAAVARTFAPWASPKALLTEATMWVRTSHKRATGRAATVRVMTLQGAKGLEADVVCFIAAEEGTLSAE